MAKQKPNKSLKCYLDTFGKPGGHVVLRDLMNNFDFSSDKGDTTSQLIKLGNRMVIDFIRDRLKGACGSNRLAYANIMTEVETLNLYEEEQP